MVACRQNIMSDNVSEVTAKALSDMCRDTIRESVDEDEDEDV